MKRVSTQTLMEKFNGKIPDGTHFTAKNLEDFLETIENHTLTKHREIILVEFENPLKAKICGMEGIGYFSNETHDKNNFYHLHNSFVEQGCQILRVQDNSIETTIPLYGHQDLSQNKLISGEEFLIQKPYLHFLSVLEIGQGILNDNQVYFKK